MPSFCIQKMIMSTSSKVPPTNDCFGRPIDR